LEGWKLEWSGSVRFELTSAHITWTSGALFENIALARRMWEITIPQRRANVFVSHIDF
jgi:hypothetical protein